MERTVWADVETSLNDLLKWNRSSVKQRISMRAKHTKKPSEQKKKYECVQKHKIICNMALAAPEKSTAPSV